MMSQIWPNRAPPDDPLFSFFRFFVFSWRHIWKNLNNLLDISSNWVQSSQIWLNRASDDPLFSFFCFSLDIYLEKSEQSTGYLLKLGLISPNRAPDDELIWPNRGPDDTFFFVSSFFPGNISGKI